MGWYVAQDVADGRPVHSVGEETVIEVEEHLVPLRLDVVLRDGEQLAARLILWDGPDFEDADAPLIACPFALALEATYPGETFTTVGVWQARRQHRVEVEFAAAAASTPALIELLGR